ncbi:MAG: glycosyltransferase family 2 protein [Stellaceae bacterium]
MVADFAAALPGALIFVYDNNSSDDTVERALAANAIVRRERAQGKGNVVRRMLADVNADVYILVDGDATYDANSAPAMVRQLLVDGLDMINGMRVSDAADAYRPGHRAGNRILTELVKIIFGAGLKDMLSGYKVMSRRLVKSMPLLSSGFEIETELAVHALSLRVPIAEMPTPYRDRPEGSASKLKTVRDGARILRTILWLIKDERPLPFFSTTAAVLAATALALGVPIITTYLEIHLVPRLPTAVLAASIMLLALLSLCCGMILDTVSRGRREMKRIAYLANPSSIASEPLGSRSERTG